MGTCLPSLLHHFYICQFSCPFYSASNYSKHCLRFEYECVVQEVKIDLKIFPCHLKNVDEILVFSVSWELMLSRRTLLGTALFNLQVFTGMLERKKVYRVFVYLF